MHVTLMIQFLVTRRHATRRTSHITRHTLCFSQVAEADQTLVALDAMWQENSPDIPKPCVVIVHTSKRSAIRLFAKKGSNHFDNVVAGTIIDEGITSDSIFDFELVANNTKRVLPAAIVCTAILTQNPQQNWRAHADVCAHELQGVARSRQRHRGHFQPRSLSRCPCHL